MKKMFSLFMVLCTILLLVGCGSKQPVPETVVVQSLEKGCAAADEFLAKQQDNFLKFDVFGTYEEEKEIYLVFLMSNSTEFDSTLRYVWSSVEVEIEAKPVYTGVAKCFENVADPTVETVVVIADSSQEILYAYDGSKVAVYDR